MALVAAEQIILEIGKEVGEPGGHASQTLWGGLMDALRDLNLHAIDSYEIEKGLSINAYNAVDWPCSCVKPLITFLERDGKALALHVDYDLLSIVNNEKKPTTLIQADQEIQDFFRIGDIGQWITNYNWTLGELYGVGQGYNHVGMVIHDKTRRQSFIRGCSLKSTDRIGYFFKTDGTNGKIDFVPSEIKEAVEYFMLAKYYRTRNPSLGQINLANYKNEFYRVQCYTSEDGIGAWVDAFRSNQISSPKL